MGIIFFFKKYIPILVLILCLILVITDVLFSAWILNFKETRNSCINEIIQEKISQNYTWRDIYSSSQRSLNERKELFGIKFFNYRIIDNNYTTFLHLYSRDPLLYTSSLTFFVEDEEPSTENNSRHSLYIWWSNSIELIIDNYMANYYYLLLPKIEMSWSMFKTTFIVLISALLIYYGKRLSKKEALFAFIFFILLTMVSLSQILRTSDLQYWRSYNDLISNNVLPERYEQLISLIDNNPTGIVNSPEYLQRYKIKEIFIGKEPIFNKSFVRIKINPLQYIYISKEYDFFHDFKSLVVLEPIHNSRIRIVTYYYFLDELHFVDAVKLICAFTLLIISLLLIMCFVCGTRRRQVQSCDGQIRTKRSRLPKS